MIETNKLFDVGTRWQHLVDVRELWQNALANLERIRPNYLSVGDKKLIAKLRVAVELMDRHINLLSKFTLGDTALGRMIDACPRLPKLTVLMPKVEDENKDSNQ